MKKINSVNGFDLPEKALANKLSQVEMEDELDHCPAPWKCPAACYGACVGCVQKKDGGK